MNVQATKRRMVMVMKVEEGVNSELYYTITQCFRAMNIDEALRKANNKICYALRTELPGLIVRNKSVTDEAMIDSDDTLIRFMGRNSIRKYAFPKRMKRDLIVCLIIEICKEEYENFLMN